MIYIGSDHGGYKLKREIKEYLDDLGYEFEDLGNEEFDETDDYPDFSFKVAEKVAETNQKGVLFCGTGSGTTIAANKVEGIRAVNCWSLETAKQAREHLDSNILCLGEKIIDWEKAKKIVQTWLETEFSEKERHKRRIEKISDYEK